MLPETEIENYVNRLADKIAESVHDSAVINAFRKIPRHQFVLHGFYIHDRKIRQYQQYLPENTDAREWLDLVYENQVLLIELHESGSPSSSSEPVLMAQMLSALDIQEGMHVLEIGTGTGYNAALLAQLVGESGEVVTTDIQDHLVERARTVLKKLFGERVRVYTNDGFMGVPEAAPYDRIIATASHTCVPPAWIEQLKVGGKLLMNLGHAGALLLLEKSEHDTKGQFLQQRGFFMSMVETQAKDDEVIENIDLPALLSLDFRCFLDFFYPNLQYTHYLAPGKQAMEEQGIRFHTTMGTDSVAFYPEGELVKLHMRGDESFAQQVLSVVRQWHDLGKPGQEQIYFEVTSDGKQVIHVMNDPDTWVEL